MVENDPLLNGWLNQEKGFTVFGAIERSMVLQAVEEQRSYKWNGNISPSKLSWDMCPVELVYSYLPRGWRGEVKLESLQKMSFGTAYHAVLQEAFSKMSGNVKSAKPKYPKDNAKIKEKLKDKRHKYETYIWLEWCKLSGWIDLLCRIKGKLAIGDIKTTNIKPSEWSKEQNLLPTIPQLTQIYCYVLAVDLLKYFPNEPVEKIFFLFHNNWCLGTEYDPRYEWHSDVREDLKNLTIDFLVNVESQLTRYNDGEDRLCTWKYCSKCTSNSVKEDFGL